MEEKESDKVLYQLVHETCSYTEHLQFSFDRAELERIKAFLDQSTGVAYKQDTYRIIAIHPGSNPDHFWMDTSWFV